MIEFVDDLPEPPPRTRRGKWDRIVAELAERPGEWAKVHTAPTRETARTVTYQMRRRFADYEWEYRGDDVYGRAVKNA